MKRLMFAVCAAICALPLFAKVELGTPFSDHAVLQRGMKVPVWGTAEPGARVSVSFADQVLETTAGTNGVWRVELSPLEASKEPRELVVVEENSAGGSPSTQTIQQSNNQTIIRDILVGEVWFASGQSNMACPLWCYQPRYRDANGALLMEMTRLPYVRHCKSVQKMGTKPLALKSDWRPFVDKKFHTMFSAVAFYYARELYLALDVPIGIVDASLGGTNIDAWTPRCGYDGCDPSIRATAEYPVKEKGAWKAETDKKYPVISPWQQPTVLFNGMVGSWVPMAMRGFIWYQGCHNAGESGLYAAKLHALYNGWSRAFENPGLKMYLAQLAPYQDGWMGIVTAQNRFVREQPNAALAVLSDVGNFDDIHPNAKEIVAKRLAVHALKRDYGFKIPEDDSPVLREAKFAGGRAELTFDHAKSWYVYSPKSTLEVPFELAGTNGVWQAAKIENFRPVSTNKVDGVHPLVDGNKLILSCENVAEPVRVRYMGRPRTAGNLYNQVALPLGAFETDR